MHGETAWKAYGVFDAVDSLEKGGQSAVRAQGCADLGGKRDQAMAGTPRHEGKGSKSDTPLDKSLDAGQFDGSSW